MIISLYNKIYTCGIKKSAKLIKSTLLEKCYFKIFKGSFSQYGEDVIIDKLLGKKHLGFYIDVGAFDPNNLSNTKRFYLKGWRGINIEPNPDKIEKFNILRPKDVNLNIGISDKKGKMKSYKFYETASYTFSEEVVTEHIKKGFRLEKKLKIEVNTLESVLNRYLKDRKIDFISIDTEGYDMVVLKGNNWKKYRPKVICIESLNVDDRNYDKKQKRFLNSKGYKKVYDNGLNSFYIDIN